MGQIDNLNGGQLARILARLDKLERGSPMNNAAIGRGGIEVYDGGVIRITNGGLSVTGTAEIIGRLFASGIVNFAGEVTITGPLDVSGPMDVSGLVTLMNDLEVASGGRIKAGSIELNPDGSAKFGTMTISPEGKITSGSAEINPDGSVKFGLLEIDTAGKVTAGGVIIDPNHLGGSVKFTNGTYVAATPNGAQLVKPGGGAVTVSAAQADMSAGAGGVIVNANGVTLQGLTDTTQKPNLYMDPTTKRLYRSTAVI